MQPLHNFRPGAECVKGNYDSHLTTEALHI